MDIKTPSGLCQLWLTCKDAREADEIAKKLLNLRLIACAKQIPVVSDYRWQGKIEHEEEVILIMEGRLDLFDQIEAAVRKLHSYNTFVLSAIPIIRLSRGSKKWLEAELK